MRQQQVEAQAVKAGDTFWHSGVEKYVTVTEVRRVPATVHWVALTVLDKNGKELVVYFEDTLLMEIRRP